MKKSIIAATAAFALAALGTPTLSAQWPAYVPPGTPKTADGKPNLDAPAPRTADGKPDFTGIWNNAFFGVPPAAGRGQGGNAAPAAGAARGQGAPTPPPTGAPAAGGGGRRGAPPVTLPADGSPPLASFFNIGAGFPDGLPFQPWAKAELDRRRADNDKDNPDAHCLPMGLLQFHEHIQPRKIVQTKDIIVIIYEANYGLRQIFLDGRKLPDNDPTPWWYGYSVGHWEGDTLVVETTNLRDGGWLDIWGSPLTDKAQITERITRPKYGQMIIDVTIDDPKAYTKPFTVRFNQRLAPSDELIEFICNENERSDAHLVGK
jgi:hypothetical protein